MASRAKKKNEQRGKVQPPAVVPASDLDVPVEVWKHLSPDERRVVALGTFLRSGLPRSLDAAELVAWVRQVPIARARKLKLTARFEHIAAPGAREVMRDLGYGMGDEQVIMQTSGWPARRVQRSLQKLKAVGLWTPEPGAPRGSGPRKPSG